MWTRLVVLLERCRAALSRRRLDAEFSDELESHISMLTE